MTIWKKHNFLFSLLLGAALIVTACSPQRIPQTGAEATDIPGAGEELEGVSIDDELRQLGAEVELVGVAQEPFFNIEGQILDVNGEEIQVFEFASEGEAQQVAATISQTGDMVGDVPTGFIGTPYFFRNSETIVLYLGQDRDMLDLLSAAFGESLTQFPQAEAADLEPAPLTGEMAQLAEELRQAGATASPLGTIQQPFFTVEGRIIDVNGEEVWVFEFPTEAAADEAAELISPDGLTIGSFQPEFVATPHFFKEGRLIALYVGVGEPVLGPLNEAMGAPLTERPGAGEEASQASQSEMYDLSDFTQDLQDEGAAVEELQILVGQPFFTVDAQGINVNGQQVQVFEFPNPEAAREAANLITPDGLTIGTNQVLFVEPPHFYQRGQLIVLYVGQDQANQDLLEQILGEQIAGGAS